MKILSKIYGAISNEILLNAYLLSETGSYPPKVDQSRILGLGTRN